MFAAVLTIVMSVFYASVRYLYTKYSCVVDLGLGTNIYGYKFSTFGSLSRVVLYFLVM